VVVLLIVLTVLTVLNVLTVLTVLTVLVPLLGSPLVLPSVGAGAAARRRNASSVWPAHLGA